MRAAETVIVQRLMIRFREKGSALLRRKASGFHRWRYAMEIGGGQWLDQDQRCRFQQPR